MTAFWVAAAVVLLIVVAIRALQIGRSRQQLEVEWSGYRLEDYEFRFADTAFVLDVGCGPGYHMKMVADQGHRVVGIDPSFDLVRDCRDKGLTTVQALGERLPFAGGTFDGVVCKVVLPYTREEVIIAEIARVLKPGGRCFLQCHGAGYYLKYVITPMDWRQSVHGLRTLLNTWAWIATGRRLPGFLGNSIYQSRRRLARYYRQNNLQVCEDTPSPSYFGLPVFTYQVLEKGISLPVRPAPSDSPEHAIRRRMSVHSVQP